ncbi:E3 ubiquitin-protein ligase bre1 [Apophysomyces ossiformis]|uniref:E3 ubiquitin protein ligase n=1 Tax=Apophysomyces ossiformis TaxID=679940 RepID=A0A8H7BYV0_9FUNG|nr:E3 ubiquitin-protein ligase bre1 [Apophysomyces ossiformis]
MSTENKRKWTDDPDSGTPTTSSAAQSRPPLKKRFTSVASNPSLSLAIPRSTQSSAPISAMPPIPEHNVNIVEDMKSQPKNILLQHMQQAKQESIAFENKNEALEKKIIDSFVRRSVVSLSWNMLREQFSLMAIPMGEAESLTEFPSHSAITNTAELEQQLDVAYKTTKNICERIFGYLLTWIEFANDLERRCNGMQDFTDKEALLTAWARKEIEDIHKCCEGSQRFIDEIERRYEALLQRTETLTDDIKTVSERLEQSKAELEKCIHTLMQVERQYDRSQSTVVASLAGGGLGDRPESAQVRSPVNTPSAASTPGGSKERSVTETSVLVDQPVAGTQQADDRVTAETRGWILDLRKKELQDMKAENDQIFEAVEEMKLQFSKLSDERMMESDYFRELQTSGEDYKNRTVYLEQRRPQLERELDAIMSEREILEDQVRSEKQAHGMAMEAEMKRLENDLSRIRSQREHYQQLLNDQISKEARDTKTNDAIISSVENEKKRIETLEAQLLNTQPDISGSKDLELVQQLDDELQMTESVLRLLNEKLKAKRDGTILSADSMKESIVLHKKKIELLQEKLESWIKMASADDRSAQLRLLMSDLDKHAKELEKLETMRDFYENNESELLQQVDRVAAIYGKLEEQSSKKTLDISYKKEQVAKLQAEKSKYAQTFSSLKEANEKQMANVAVLRRTSEQQLEHVRQLEEREKSLESQVEEKEIKLRDITKEVDDSRDNLISLTQQCDICRYQLTHLELRSSEVQKKLNEGVQALEEERAARKKQEEKIKRKQDTLSAIEGGDNSEEKQLTEECEEFRALLKCSACHMRFRSQLLTRCMHTFCKECIDARLETRQRRCPTCGEPFGVSDAKSFYM